MWSDIQSCDIQICLNFITIINYYVCILESTTHLCLISITFVTMYLHLSAKWIEIHFKNNNSIPMFSDRAIRAESSLCDVKCFDCNIWQSLSGLANTQFPNCLIFLSLWIDNHHQLGKKCHYSAFFSSLYKLWNFVPSYSMKRVNIQKLKFIS